MVSKFQARDVEELDPIKKLVYDSYEFIRTKLNHGLELPSKLEKSAMKRIPLLEQYCREAIFFFIGLDRIGELKSLLERLHKHHHNDCPKIMTQQRKKADEAFWKGRRIKMTAGDKEVVMQMWSW